MKHFIKALGLAFHCNELAHIADLMPLSLQTVHNALGIAGDDFTVYVVCPSCQSVYHYEDCIIRRPYGQSESKHCCHVAYPNHPQCHAGKCVVHSSLNQSKKSVENF